VENHASLVLLDAFDLRPRQEAPRVIDRFGSPKTYASWALLPLLLGTLAIAGCETDGYPEAMTYPNRTDPLVVGKPDKDAPAQDRPGEYPKVLFPYLDDRDKYLLDPAKVSADQRRQLGEELTNIFGTPAHPKVSGGPSELQGTLENLRTKLELDDATLLHGSSMYRQQCLHCHGLTGDGRGATSPWVNPHPRDYRLGRFKFTSSKQDEGRRKPRREDLIRTIYEGIEGSSMPTFRMLTTPEIEALASYVIHLSLRGEMEYSILVAADKGELDGGVTGGVKDYLEVIGKNWLDAQQSLIQPEMIPPANMTDAQMTESVRNGMRLFTTGKASCISCHTDFGRQSAFKFDAWGTVTRPIDLTLGIYHGGRRPIDLFWRIHSGVNGSGMTAFGSQVSSKDIWDIVHFLQVLPYPGMRQKYDIKLENN
jgi:mono/diheme cytochrome c family protein